MRLAALALCLIALGAVAGCSGRPDPALRVEGNRFTDAEGNPLRLLGVNRSGAEYACIQGWGVFDGPVDARSIEAMSAWRINTVRIPLNEDCWLGINGAPASFSGDPYRRAVSAYVERLRDAGLYVVLDLHWSAPGTQQATGQEPAPDLDHAPAFWSSVARTFKDDPAVAFDLYNEAYDVSWQCWRDGCVMPGGWRAAGMQTLVDAVRSAGASQPVIATGPNWGNNLSAWLEHRPDDPAGQLAAGFHTYDYSSCADAGCWTKKVEPVAREVPVVTTEVGQTACSATFLDRFMGWADAAGVSYLGWTWNPTGCEAPALIRSWGGVPTATGAQLRAHLLAL